MFTSDSQDCARSSFCTPLLFKINCDLSGNFFWAAPCSATTSLVAISLPHRNRISGLSMRKVSLSAWGQKMWEGSYSNHDFFLGRQKCAGLELRNIELSYFMSSGYLENYKQYLQKNLLLCSVKKQHEGKLKNSLSSIFPCIGANIQNNVYVCFLKVCGHCKNMINKSWKLIFLQYFKSSKYFYY